MDDQTPFGNVEANSVAPARWKWYFNADGQPVANGVGNWMFFEVREVKGQWALLKEIGAKLDNPQPLPIHQSMGEFWAHLPSMGGCWTQEK